jgi:hypothetical protein
VVDLAGIDQVVALAPADINAVELVFLQCKAGDRQRLALSAGFLYPVVAAARQIPAIAYLGDHALKADATGML